MSELNNFKRRAGNNLRPIISGLDETLMAICPEFEAKAAWRGYAYLRKGKYSCMLAIYKDHIKLMIWRGIELADENNILEGSGTNIRHIKYFDTEDIKIKNLQKLLRQQFKKYDAGLNWEG